MSIPKPHKKNRFRVTIKNAEFKRVARDEEHAKGTGVIHGISVMTKGTLAEISGDIRPWENDDETLDKLVELGNDKKLGVKARFGHPSMSARAVGTFVGRFENFRREKNRTRADLFISKSAFETPDGNLGKYVLDLAENDPDMFGVSIVFDANFVAQLDDDGAQKKDSEGNDLPELVRLTHLYATDVVDDPATNKGLFGYSDSVIPSAVMTEFLDTLLADPNAVETVTSFLERYRAKSPSNKFKGDNEMKFGDITLENLTKERPDLVEAIQKAAVQVEPVTEPVAVSAIPATPAVPEILPMELGTSEGRDYSDEVERVETIKKFAVLYGVDESVADLIVAQGLSVSDAKTELRAARLESLKAVTPDTAGANDDPETVSVIASDDDDGEKKFGKIWDTKPEVRKEFGNREDYISFKQLEASGRMSIAGGK